VLDRHPDGRYQVDFKLMRSLADIRFPISIGDILFTEVLDPGPPLRLRIHPPQASVDPYSKGELYEPFRDMASIGQQLRKDIDHLLQLASQDPKKLDLPIHIHQRLHLVESHLRPLDIGPDAIALLARLSPLISDSGLYFEKKLARLIQLFFQQQPGVSGLGKQVIVDSQPIFKKDVKPHLLVLSKFLEHPNSLRSTTDIHRQTSRIRTGINLLLEHIGEQHRHVAEQRPGTNTVAFFHHTAFLDNPDQRATLKIYHSRGKTDQDQKGKRISLLLKMNRVGMVRADLLLFDDNLQIVLFVASDVLKQQFEKQLKDLSLILEKLFTTLTCHVHVSQRKIAEFSGIDISPAADKIVDVRI
jgi:hypothetical protein